MSKYISASAVRLPSSCPVEIASFQFLGSTPDMESLSDTIWDVVIAGTGLSQSLLALYALLELSGADFQY